MEKLQVCCAELLRRFSIEIMQQIQWNPVNETISISSQQKFVLEELRKYKDIYSRAFKITLS